MDYLKINNKILNLYKLCSEKKIPFKLSNDDKINDIFLKDNMLIVNMSNDIEQNIDVFINKIEKIEKEISKIKLS